MAPGLALRSVAVVAVVAVVVAVVASPLAPPSTFHSLSFLGWPFTLEIRRFNQWRISAILELEF